MCNFYISQKHQSRVDQKFKIGPSPQIVWAALVYSHGSLVYIPTPHTTGADIVFPGMESPII